MKKENSKGYKEWFLQADYDFETAEAMYKSGRYLYTVFMSHLCIEKALKGLLVKRHDVFPPKTHNLIYLVEKIELELTEKDTAFVFQLNDVSLPTRYPEDLKKLMRVYTKEKAKQILDKTNILLKWIKEQ